MDGDLESIGMTINFGVIEQMPPHRLVLKTGADGAFEGHYAAEFRQDETHTIGTFTEEPTALGLIPKVMRRIFVNQKHLILEYATDAKAETIRRNSDSHQKISMVCKRCSFFDQP